jgi:hypothetical protein
MRRPASDQNPDMRDMSATSTADYRRKIGVRSGIERSRQMESQRRPVGRETPPRGVEEGRLMIDRAERRWRRQVAKEEVPVRTGSSAAFRWLLLAVALGAIVFLMFEQLARLG